MASLHRNIIMSTPFQLTLPELPVSFINEDHAHARELLEVMVSLASDPNAPNIDLGKSCRDFFEHNRVHFGREEAAMQATGFPPYRVHKSEHDNALNWLDDLARQAESGPASEALRKTIVVDLPAWYLRHIQTMDTVTANWISAHSAD